MKVKNLTIQHLKIPMRIPFEQANSAAKTSSSVIVRLETGAGTIGYGESCPRTYVTGESEAGVQQQLEAFYPELCNCSFVTLEDIQQLVCEDLPQRMGKAAICALEIALLDAWSWESGQPLVEALGGQLRESYHYTGVVPFGNLQKIGPILQRFAFPEIKIKATADVRQNVDRIRQLHQVCGNKTMRVDANCGWSFTQGLENATRLIEQGVTCIEQPFLPANDRDMAYLTEHFGRWTDIMADESLTDQSSAHRLIATSACNRFNLKISKNGGILNTLKIYHLATQHGIPCQLGAHFGETSILTAAGMIVAALAPNLVAMEGGLGTHLLAYDLATSSLKIDASARICGSALGHKGLGVDIDENHLPSGKKKQPYFNIPAILLS